jgi:hypothetical protein
MARLSDARARELLCVGLIGTFSTLQVLVQYHEYSFSAMVVLSHRHSMPVALPRLGLLQHADHLPRLQPLESNSRASQRSECTVRWYMTHPSLEPDHLVSHVPLHLLPFEADEPVLVSHGFEYRLVVVLGPVGRSHGDKIPRKSTVEVVVVQLDKGPVGRLDLDGIVGVGVGVGSRGEVDVSLVGLGMGRRGIGATCCSPPDTAARVVLDVLHVRRQPGHCWEYWYSTSTARVLRPVQILV